MERKEFLKNSLAICGISLVSSSIIASCTKSSSTSPSSTNFTLDLSNSANAALNVLGGSLIANGVLIIRISTSLFEAYSSYCTHQGCSVQYSSPYIVCPCHGGTFSLTTGAVVSGPPPSGLTKYSATLSGKILTIQP